MLRAYTADQVRAAEEPLLAAGVPLMARAAVALECAVVEELRGRSGSAPLARAGRVLVLVGSGNNGGDGLFAAAGLARRGVDVAVVLLGSRPHGAGLAAVRATSARVRDLSGFAPAPVQHEVPGLLEGPLVEVIVDAMTGIGGSGGLRGVPGVVVATLRALLETREKDQRPIVVAVDVPSGIGVDDGTVPGPVLPADRTVTMGVAKTGLLLPPAAGVSGRVDVVNLGLEAELTGVAPTLTRLTSAEVAHSVPVPGSGSDKYRRGVVGVLAGSAAYPGAAVLACEGAAPLAGMVRYVGPERAESLVLGRRPEVVCGAGRVQAWVLGSGIGVDDDARLAEARAVLAGALTAVEDERVPVVLDAGAIDLVTPGVTLPPWVVLTPHAGELARLLTRCGMAGEAGDGVERAEVEAEPVRWLREVVRLTGATVLLKGSVTLVAAPGGVLWSQAGAPGWLATAGAGDVLAGVVGAFLAGSSMRVVRRPRLAAEVVAAAVVVHGLAATIASEAVGGGPITALDVAHAVPRAVAHLLATP